MIGAVTNRAQHRRAGSDALFPTISTSSLKLRFLPADARLQRVQMNRKFANNCSIPAGIFAKVESTLWVLAVCRLLKREKNVTYSLTD